MISSNPSQSSSSRKPEMQSGQVKQGQEREVEVESVTYNFRGKRNEEIEKQVRAIIRTTQREVVGMTLQLGKDREDGSVVDVEFREEEWRREMPSGQGMQQIPGSRIIVSDDVMRRASQNLTSLVLDSSVECYMGNPSPNHWKKYWFLTPEVMSMIGGSSLEPVEPEKNADSGSEPEVSEESDLNLGAGGSGAKGIWDALDDGETTFVLGMIGSIQIASMVRAEIEDGSFGREGMSTERVIEMGNRTRRFHELFIIDKARAVLRKEDVSSGKEIGLDSDVSEAAEVCVEFESKRPKSVSLSAEERLQWLGRSRIEESMIQMRILEEGFINSKLKASGSKEIEEANEVLRMEENAVIDDFEDDLRREHSDHWLKVGESVLAATSDEVVCEENFWENRLRIISAKERETRSRLSHEAVARGVDLSSRRPDPIAGEAINKSRWDTTAEIARIRSDLYKNAVRELAYSFEQVSRCPQDELD